MDVTPLVNSRSIAVGCSGSGKSTLAKAIIRRFPYVVAIDPKPSLGLQSSTGYLEGFALCRSPGELQGAALRAHWLQYRPDPEWQNDETYDRVYMWLFRCGNRYIYTDESYLVQTGRFAGPGLMACITSGRERGIGMLSATQRPTHIDQRLISESEFSYTFQLRKPEDRQRMSDCSGHPELKEMAEGHSFWFVAPGQAPVRQILGGRYLK